MQPDELAKYAQENAERFWRDAGNHWLNDNFDLQASHKVIEVGGYLGEWTDYVQHRYECRVTVYEPVEEFANRMAKRFSARPKIEVVNAAVGDYDGEGNIAVMGEGSSMVHGGCSTPVRVADIDRIVREARTVDMLALNCEGMEYVILERLLATGEIARVGQLLVQFHTLIPDAFERRAAIREKLARTHNEAMCYPFCWERWERK